MTVQDKALQLLRSLFKMGVTLNGCGCCGSNTMMIDGVTYDVEGGMGLNGAHDYVFSLRGQKVFTLSSNGKDENVIGWVISS